MANWKKSSFCGNSSCIEVNFDSPGTVFVRSGYGSTYLAADREEWDAFIAGVKNGEFDAVDS